MTADDDWRTPRSVLFVPGLTPDLVAKVDRWEPDVVVVDLEDAVPPDAKEEARGRVRQVLADGSTGDVRAPLLLRVNSVDTAEHRADLEAAAELAGAGRIRGIVLPKHERADHLDAVRSVIGPGVYVMAGIETVLGVADSRGLLAAGVDAAYFGAEDFVADLGGRRTAEGDEVLYARSQVSLHARLAGVPVVDQVFLTIRDRDGLRDDTRAGLALGYHGKLCIHPDQVGVVHEVYRPTAEEIDRANRMVAGAASGVAVVDGVMVDAVHVRQAESVLARARR